MLTKDEARAIMDIVSRDPKSKTRIESKISKLVPDSWGIAGGLRNLGYIIQRKDPTEKEVADKVCTGISDATSAAINSNIKAKNASVRRVVRAEATSRVYLGVIHWATKIQMEDSQEHVFDWHATLEVSNPLMYQKVTDWNENTGSVTYENFKGWK